MSIVDTANALAAMTDPGKFERLATAVLREAESAYRALGHTGVNLAGKPVKSPLDGISFVQGSDTPHLIAVHHTITARDGLEKKWLHDPSKVVPRVGGKPTAPAGDILKTSEIVADERKRTPDLKATLVLTTNEEPSEALVRDAAALGRAHSIDVDVWSRSRLTHFLDFHATGQWIRREFFGIQQQILSGELLHELSKQSLRENSPPDNSSAWVERGLDSELDARLLRGVNFLVAPSGTGKTVACYRWLSRRIDANEFGITLSHKVVAEARNLEHAVSLSLSELQPTLLHGHNPVLSICSPERSLNLIIEDINRSGQTRLLAEKIAGWCEDVERGASSPSRWRLVCPLWPEIILSLSPLARKRIESMVYVAGGFTESEGEEAVLQRSRLEGAVLSALNAKETARALGYDPLLVALSDYRHAVEAHQVIDYFVENNIARCVVGNVGHVAAEYRQALRALSMGMLRERKIEPRWLEVGSWSHIEEAQMPLLAHLANRGEIMSFSGPSAAQLVTFRHDRVRDWLMADAMADSFQHASLDHEIIEDPYYSEIVALTLRACSNPRFTDYVTELNPLALFYAARLTSGFAIDEQEPYISAIRHWLQEPNIHDRSYLQLRLEATAVSTGIDSESISEIVCDLGEQSWNSRLARLRNGELSGGIELCSKLEFGINAPWRDEQIDHAMAVHGPRILEELSDFLQQPSIDEGLRRGAVRLAGHLARPELGSSLENCWRNDPEPGALLADYLWAIANCCALDPKRFLDPVCDAWALLIDRPTKNGLPSPRNDLAAHNVRWGFIARPPVAAIGYFIERARQPELKWPITYMLHGVNEFNAVLFVVEELAEIERELEDGKSFSHFSMTAKDEWRRSQESSGRKMSPAIRDSLCARWQDASLDPSLRKAAFRLWSGTVDGLDVPVLQVPQEDDLLAEWILQHRLLLGDQAAISEYIEKLRELDSDFWWQFSRYIWSQELTDELEDHLSRRRSEVVLEWEGTYRSDWITAELIMQLSHHEAESILVRHWDHLQYVSYFVQTALYVATEPLLVLVADTVKECPDGTQLFTFLTRHIGVKTSDRPGLVHERQVAVLAPYLDFLEPGDIARLWRACNDRGWFTLRRRLLDGRLEAPLPRELWDSASAAHVFDQLLEDESVDWIGHRIDSWMDTGVSWNEILSAILRWFNTRQSIEAVQLLVSAVTLRGTREDFKLVSAAGMEDFPGAKPLIEDMKFAVRRRTLL